VRNKSKRRAIELRSRPRRQAEQFEKERGQPQSLTERRTLIFNFAKQYLSRLRLPAGEILSSTRFEDAGIPPAKVRALYQAVLSIAQPPVLAGIL
jgi:hypothetical protein